MHDKTNSSSPPSTDSSARDRIISAALRLFYAKGYPNTGINEILETAGSFKKTLYIHFPSKRDLGKSYLSLQEASILALIERIMRREKVYSKFIKSWIRVVKRGIKSHYQFGCPIANFANQTHEDDEFRRLTTDFIRRWQKLFENYLSEIGIQKKKKATLEQIRETAEAILLYYQGAMQLYGMSGDMKYLNRLEKELLKLENDLGSFA
ncbi:transcriptional regulator, TetR family [Leptospira broomii serovar Hurstbridge str. 5399]|uniref:Transcriptional regulator, TetR family n=1 Tax=Leptospira broomii serovar Hurstbridge str. 5399 TaxID=1049789 RepID=T0GGZ7_9LEPT|nr:TetR/AcrR family transcriptional regulator [Leptospira broomii]EQA44683.1 transcriptional regulator, TetR family [Leptospira broomii serovar Hurstbridge str. 5399]